MQRLFRPDIKTVLFFDLNDTLIDQRASRRACFLEVLEQFTGRWESEAARLNPKAVYQRFDRSLRGLARNRKPMSKAKMQKICLRRALEPYPVEVTPAFQEAFFKAMRMEKKHQVRLFPGTAQTLERLSGQYRLAVISNSSGYSMNELHLNAWIPEDHVYTAQACGSRKPQPAIFRKALSGMNVKGNQAVMIGNSWRNDVMGAVRSDMDAVWIRRKQKAGAVRKWPGRTIVSVRSIKDLDGLFFG